MKCAASSPFKWAAFEVAYQPVFSSFTFLLNLENGITFSKFINKFNNSYMPKSIAIKNI
jgi:hypothetical protein